MPVNKNSCSIEPVVTIGKWPMTFPVVLRRARSIREKALGGSCPEFSDTELGLASQVQADALKVRIIIPKKIET
jgi:hypothetical protein